MAEKEPTQYEKTRSAYFGLQQFDEEFGKNFETINRFAGDAKQGFVNLIRSEIDYTGMSPEERDALIQSAIDNPDVNAVKVGAQKVHENAKDSVEEGYSGLYSQENLPGLVKSTSKEGLEFLVQNLDTEIGSRLEKLNKLSSKETPEETKKAINDKILGDYIASQNLEEKYKDKPKTLELIKDLITLFGSHMIDYEKKTEEMVKVKVEEVSANPIALIEGVENPSETFKGLYGDLYKMEKEQAEIAQYENTLKKKGLSIVPTSALKRAA